MAVVVSVKKVATTLWDHKKKSAFGFVCVGALVRYIRHLESDRQIFRGYCQQALQYGNENILATVLPRRVTVLVKDHAARVLFEKRALPLLNLAGLHVDLVLPENPKQLTTIASVLNRKDADLVYIVGGDDTVSNVLTGLLASPNNDGGNHEVSGPARKNVGKIVPPVAIFSNISSKSLEAQCENAMAAIRGAVNEANVLQVKINGADPVCILNTIHWGKFADTEVAIPRYWYWGPLKNRFAYFWKAMTAAAPEPLNCNLTYVEPCSGCSKCYVAPVTRKVHWLWQLFVGRPRKAEQAPDFSKVINEDCGAVRTMDMNTVELIVKNDANSNFPVFNFLYGPAQMGETGFLIEGWRRCGNNDPVTPSKEYGQTIQAREMEVNFMKMDEAQSSKITIGGELMELKEFTLKAIPKAIQLIRPWISN